MENFKKFKFKSNPSCRCHCCGFCCPCSCNPPFIPVPPNCNFLLYVTDAGQLATPDNRVSVIDTGTNTIVATIPVGTGTRSSDFTKWNTWLCSSFLIE